MARCGSNWCVRSTVADRANNAVLQERDGRWSVQGDPTEGALIVAARKAGWRLKRSTLASPASAKCRSPPSAS